MEACLYGGVGVSVVRTDYSQRAKKSLRPSVRVTVTSALTVDEIKSAASLMDKVAKSMFGDVEGVPRTNSSKQ